MVFHSTIQYQVTVGLMLDNPYFNKLLVILGGKLQAHYKFYTLYIVTIICILEIVLLDWEMAVISHRLQEIITWGK